MNSVDRQVESVITHCKTVKELWDFLKFIFGKSNNLNRTYALLQEIFCHKHDKRKLMDYFLEFKKYNEELTSLLACKSVEEELTSLLACKSVEEMLPQQKNCW